MNFQCPMCQNEDEIVNAIKNSLCEVKHMKEIKNVFFNYQDGLSTQRVIDFLRGIIHETEN